MKRKNLKSSEHLPPEYVIQRRLQFEELAAHEEFKVSVPDYSGLENQIEQGLTAPFQVRPEFTPPTNGSDVNISLESSGSLPANLAKWLRPYQIEGAAALYSRYIRQTGFILGDDMGLGKTVQVISFLTVAFGKTADRRDSRRMRVMSRAGRWYPKVLLICPGTLVLNWRQELNRWGWWIIYDFMTNKKEDSLSAARRGSCEILITTYETYRLHESELNLIEWDAVILDECQNLKSLQSSISKALMKVNALCRIGLTGSAVQNSYNDLWAILNWANPGKLGLYSEWVSKVTRPLQAGQSHSATILELANARICARQLSANLLPRFFLRRTKQLIVDQLPQKRDLIVFCRLSALQAEAYFNFTKLQQSVFARSLEQGKSSDSILCLCPDSHDSDCKCAGQNLLSKFQVAKNIFDHLALCLPQNEDPGKTRKKSACLLKVLLPKCYRKYLSRTPLENLADPMLCGKWTILQSLLAFWKQKNDKVLIFSHSTRMLMIIESLMSYSANYVYSRLDGSQSYEERQRQVDEFNQNPNVFAFLISTKAGGVGLNLVAANKVVIFDLSWNPTYDLQAMDRAFRIGQKRNVEIYRLVSSGTLEEVIYAQQIYKQQQANIAYTGSSERRYFSGIQGQAEAQGELFGAANMFALSGDKPLLKNILHRTNVAESVSLETGFDIKELIFPNFDSAGQAELRSNRKLSIGLSNESVAIPKTDPIMAILNHTGADSVHDNAQVIGHSTIEAEISSLAMTAISESNPFNKKKTLESVFEIYSNKHVQRPPVDVCLRQFNSMAKFAGFKSTQHFAIQIEQMSMQARRSFLDRFYSSLETDRPKS
ncbi:P-loop containing nucleoside triphosphate hydrolase protein [Lipomyces oligophaga]|uniref:P-loop containing nucleoside triphosphate hydrolase protein n=1 Tax=Lipomyces oligophaga TaxID=45792 RepID=UPI0034CEDC14